MSIKRCNFDSLQFIEYSLQNDFNNDENNQSNFHMGLSISIKSIVITRVILLSAKFSNM